MKKTLIDNQSGEIIIFVVFIILFMVMFVGLFISKLLIWQTNVSINAAHSVQAYYIADSGAEAVMYHLANSDPDDLSLEVGQTFTMPNSPDFDFEDDACQATITSSASSGLGIKIIGNYKGVTSRAIELNW